MTDNQSMGHIATNTRDIANALKAQARAQEGVAEALGDVAFALAAIADALQMSNIQNL